MNIYCITSNPNFTNIQMMKLKALGKFVILKTVKEPNENLIDKVKDANILLISPSGIDKLSSKFLRSLKDLQFISLLSIGYDWIDLRTASNLRIPISNVKGANSESVAEHVWGMILSLSKRIADYDRSLHNGGKTDYRLFKGIELYGKTLGVIGTGEVGKKVAYIAKGFNMNVLGVNRSGNKCENIHLTTLTKLLRISDVVTICIPLTSETKNLISFRELGLMKKGSILVNCAREEIVDKKAVIKAAQDRKLFGYGIDTNVMKEIPMNDPYLKESNIVITGHNASATTTAEQNTFNKAIDNIYSFLQGTPANLINVK